MKLCKKLRIGIIFGGVSLEHEVSLRSAAAIIRTIDKSKYIPVPIGITKDGAWFVVKQPEILFQKGVLKRENMLFVLMGKANVSEFEFFKSNQFFLLQDIIDVVFPVLHGPYGEDGTVQGLLELLNIPYVGAGVTASALGINKVFQKILFRERGFNVPNFLVFSWSSILQDLREVILKIEDTLSYPVFVKPCALGSSVGITKAKGAKELQEALNIAIKYDHKIIVEQAIEAREIECSILGNQDPKASLLGEIIPSSEFYDYRAKYISQSSKLIIPADLRSELTSEIRNLAVAAFKTIDCTGMARVDFLVRRRDEKVFLNEINTIPGFTEISMYPKLWEATGIPFKELIDRLIQLAIERHSEAQRLFGLGNQIGSKNLGNCKE